MGCDHYSLHATWDIPWCVKTRNQHTLTLLPLVNPVNHNVLAWYAVMVILISSLTRSSRRPLSAQLIVTCT